MKVIGDPVGQQARRRRCGGKKMWLNMILAVHKWLHMRLAMKFSTAMNVCMKHVYKGSVP
jgi:uncharacterized protein (DUF983 family)